MSRSSAPSDCLQTYAEPFWEEDTSPTLCRGRLVWANLPHVMAEHSILTTEGRAADPTDHTRAIYAIKKVNQGEVQQASRLPVAGLQSFEGEVFLVRRAKIRPAIVLGVKLNELPKELTRGATKRWTHPTAIVAPCYGVLPDGRAGLSPPLLQRVRRCEYPNYLYLHLPDEANPSVARLDQLQPIGTDAGNYTLKKHRLSADALLVLDEWLHWLFSGEIPEGCVLEDIRNSLLDLE